MPGLAARSGDRTTHAGHLGLSSMWNARAIGAQSRIESRADPDTRFKHGHHAARFDIHPVSDGLRATLIEPAYCLPMLELAMVGTGGMLPLPNRWLSSALIRYAGHLLLFDCGEGTQISLRSLGWGIKDIDLILISHVHGDHVAGLPGLLLTQGNSARTEPVEIVGPPGLVNVVNGLRVVAPYLPFEVRCRELDSGASLALTDLRITCVEADHHVPCLAYRIDLTRARRFLPERARALGIPVAEWRRLQRAESVGGVHPEDVLGPPRAGLSIGLVTDTRPTSAIAELIAGVDLLVSEATFGDDDDQMRAVERRHMTFREAATLAAAARVGQLVLTHFSPSVTQPERFAANARAVFANTTVGSDHLTVTLRFPKD
jgi:ribonuclease Z